MRKILTGLQAIEFIAAHPSYHTYIMNSGKRTYTPSQAIKFVARVSGTKKASISWNVDLRWRGTAIYIDTIINSTTKLVKKANLSSHFELVTNVVECKRKSDYTKYRIIFNDNSKQVVILSNIQRAELNRKWFYPCIANVIELGHVRPAY